MKKLIIIVISLIVFGCNLKQKKEEINYPEWWEKREIPELINFFGTAVDKTENNAKEKATLEAILQLKQYIQVYIIGYAKNKNIVDENLDKLNFNIISFCYSLFERNRIEIIQNNISIEKIAGTNTRVFIGLAIHKNNVFNLFSDILFFKDRELYGLLKEKKGFEFLNEKFNIKQIENIKNEEELYNMFKNRNQIKPLKEGESNE